MPRRRLQELCRWLGLYAGGSQEELAQRVGAAVTAGVRVSVDCPVTDLQRLGTITRVLRPQCVPYAGECVPGVAPAAAQQAGGCWSACVHSGCGVIGGGGLAEACWLLASAAQCVLIPLPPSPAIFPQLL